MPWAVYQQMLDPLAGQFAGSAFVSTIIAAIPVLVLFCLLVPFRWPAHWAGGTAALSAIAIAVLVFRMSPIMASMAFVHGAAFGLLPVGWTIFSTMLLYNVTVQTGKFDIVRRSVASLSGDARIQAILIAFAFGAFLEGAAGGGTPVAICGAILVGLGFDPFKAAVLCLIANTSPVAYGGLGTPLITLTGVTGLPTEVLSVMAGHQLPLLSLFVPLYMVRCMCPWRKTWEVWPALLVSGGSFAVFQYVFATIHLVYPSLVLYHMTDVGGGIFSLAVTAIFLRYWQPAVTWHFDGARQSHQDKISQQDSLAAKLTTRSVCIAWAPFVLMSLLLLVTGLLREQEGTRDREGRGPIFLGPIQTAYKVPIPFLDRQTLRDERLHDANLGPQKPESAEFNFAWITSPGSPVFVAALLTMLFLRMKPTQIASVFRQTAQQMSIPIPTIAFMLGLSYVTRYAGMDATLGVAFASTGLFYPLFAALLGWLGVFLTGTDAGSNALFGSLQKITAQTIFPQYHEAYPHLLAGDQLQVLICTANSTGGVMGKMIDAQSIVVATTATNQMGREADIFKAVIWHSLCLAIVVGVICLLQAYVPPFTLLVPSLAR